MTTTTIEQHRALLGSAFDQAVEARKRCGYIRDALRRGDTFCAGEDLKLAIAALDDATRDLAYLQEEDDEPEDDDPTCVCGTARSEHQLLGCPEGFQTPASWHAEVAGIEHEIRHRDDYGDPDDYDPPRQHPEGCDCDDCGYENHGAHLQLLGRSSAMSRIFDEQ